MASSGTEDQGGSCDIVRSYPAIINQASIAMDVLVWYLDGTGRSLGNRAMVAWLARKKQVKVILVHRSSPSYR